MYKLKPDEKLTPVMVYTDAAVFNGSVVTKKIARVNTWLRTEGAPTFLRLLNAQMIRPDNPDRIIKFDEQFIPVPSIIGFHVGQGIENEVDYDEHEENRMMEHVKVVLGSFLVEGKIRISTQTDLNSSIEQYRIAWSSIYHATISNFYLSKLNIQTELMLVRHEGVSFGIIG
ncbi:MAG: hypothetical protein ISR59_03255 [Anaerolineales bacterium]|uniref:Uncharacterized protein n=1 Tax=Candidatus Desulfolinea nitratireducens TaxID=2841698 RepID=A0A8J6TK49_9CHLR|nr:hypothetical protein [Candidatus Desulfolinea nitratireducens]MBL6960101.1 hypothetical protein [Anaerolineales bacterium]